MTYNVLIGTLNPTHSLVVISANVHMSILFVGSVMVNKVLSFSHRSCSHRLKLLQPVEYSIVVVVVYFNLAVVQPNSVIKMFPNQPALLALHILLVFCTRLQPGRRTGLSFSFHLNVM